ASGTLPRPASRAPVLWARRDCVVGCGTDGAANGKPERTPLAKCTFYPNLPVHHGDQSLGDRQPQSSAPILTRARAVYLRKHLKELPLGLSRDPDAGVDNRKMQHRLGRVGLDARD